MNWVAGLWNLATKGLSERRRVPRFATDGPVLIQAVNGTSTEISGNAVNVSARGIMFRTALPIVKNSRLKLVVRLPGQNRQSDRALVCTGRVIRLQRDGFGGFAIAVTFDKVRETEG